MENFLNSLFSQRCEMVWRWDRSKGRWPLVPLWLCWAYSRDQDTANCSFSLPIGWKAVLESVCLALSPLQSLSQQCSRSWAEGRAPLVWVESLRTSERCLRQTLNGVGGSELSLQTKAHLFSPELLKNDRKSVGLWVLGSQCMRGF